MKYNFNEHIDRNAGIDILNVLKLKKIDTPHCINSSGKDSQDSMNDAGFTETMFILNSSGKESLFSSFSNSVPTNV